MTVDILGTRYHVLTDDSLEEKIDGYCDPFKKEIRVRSKHLIGDRNLSDDDRDKYYATVIRHEAVHAFFYESGMSRWYDDEDLVEWVAIQLPKIDEAVRGCI